MQKRNEKTGVIRWISNMIGRTKLMIVLLLLIQMFLGISGVIQALLLRSLVNHAVEANYNAFVSVAVILVGFILVQIAANAVVRFLEEYTKSTVENRLKHELFRNILVKDYGAVTSTHSGEWMNRLTSDVTVVADGATMILPGLAGMLVKLIGAFVAIIVLEPRFLYVLIPGGVVLVILSTVFRKVMKRLHKDIQEADGRFRIFVTEYISSLPIVKTFSKEEDALREADGLMEQHKAARMKRNHFSNICNVGFAIGMRGIYILGAVFCGYGILTRSMSYGNFTAVIQLINQIQNPFANITGYLPKYYAMLASAERLMEIEDYEQTKVEDFGIKKVLEYYQNSFAGLTMENIDFYYNENNPVLSDFSMQINKGDFVAFTGRSGCGKSTVLKLLLGLYKPIKGSISTPKGYGKLFSYVPQGNLLMSGTVRSVVAFADSSKEKDEEKLRNALEISCADFVYELPDGLDTVLGERGTGLSEGQMQRISIARAVFSDSPILLLDEATSALDGETEKNVLENIRKLTDKTVIIVTHRMAALQVCNRRIEFGESE